MNTPLDDTALGQLFSQAHSHSNWQEKAISDQVIKQLYELTKLGPTSANCCPARFVFITSDAAKAKLKPCLSSGNVGQTMTAPCTVIVAYDSQFYDQLPTLFPYADAKSWFTSSSEAAYETAMRNSSLQGAYLLIAARALCLDTGAMSGFDPDKLNATFFADSSWKVNFLINLGYGVPDKVHQRLPRLSFDDACKVL